MNSSNSDQTNLAHQNSDVADPKSSEIKNSEIKQSEFNWVCQPEADQMFAQLIEDFCDDCESIHRIRLRMFADTGTRLCDWLDHISLGNDTKLNGEPLKVRLLEFGFELGWTDESGEWFTHNGGVFVPICLSVESVRRLVICVEAVDDFLAAQRKFDVTIEGEKFSQFRRAMIARQDDCEFWICERQGFSGWTMPVQGSDVRLKAVDHFEAFKTRRRDFDLDRKGISLASELIDQAIADLGIDWTCELFFTAERDYWQRRNLAARVQKSRQDCLGLGWANHDHHTYRSSRSEFAPMIAIFEQLGFHCRERFYAGEEAGWGAQVLEQPTCGIVIFADVDLEPEEIAGDFAHGGLDAKAELGTVGLWCQLHGEALLQAGMHHLECLFDFDAVRIQLEHAGIESMAPFTDCGYLRQAFTAGEVWQVDRQRVEQAVAKGFLDQKQADKFIAEGAIGSHLEILERNEGFKGFSQTGVSDIILKTDPRKVESSQ
jgi:hypothetical protein